MQGFLQSLAMAHAIEMVNNSSLIPGIKLGYEIYDTCSEATLAVSAALRFLSTYNTSVELLAFRCNYSDYTPKVKAVIGDSYSETSIAVARLLNTQLIPQVDTSLNIIFYSLYCYLLQGSFWTLWCGGPEESAHFSCQLVANCLWQFILCSSPSQTPLLYMGLNCSPPPPLGLLKTPLGSLFSTGGPPFITSLRVQTFLGFLLEILRATKISWTAALPCSQIISWPVLHTVLSNVWLLSSQCTVCSTEWRVKLAIDMRLWLVRMQTSHTSNLSYKWFHQQNAKLN